MEIIELSTENQGDIIDQCLKQLVEPGSVLLVPTETVYGLICAWDDSAGREKIYQLKNRMGHKPLQMFIAEVGELHGYDIVESQFLTDLCRHCCPGPITIVVPRIHSDEKVGFRIPDHPFMLELLKRFGKPIAATSANLSGESNCLTVHDAIEQLAGQPDLVVDEGAIHESSLASTVIEIKEDGYSILRQGPISDETIKGIFDNAKT